MTAPAFTVACPAPSSPPRLTFGPALTGPGHGELRQRLVELSARFAPDQASPETIHADVLPLPRDARRLTPPGAEDSSAEMLLLFDIHRLFLYRPRRGGDAASLLFFLEDGYPIQPLRRLAQRVAEDGYVFLYPLETLDLLFLAWRELGEGEVAHFDLVTGQVSCSRVPEHPRRASDDPEAKAPEARQAFRPLEDRVVDASLRGGFPADLDALVSPAGVVHRRFTVRDRLSLPFTTAEVRWHEGRRRESCFGKSRREDRSRTVAVCEALERFQVAVKPSAENLVYGSYRELRDRALDPTTLFFGRAEGCPGDSLPPFDPDAELHWTRAAPAGGGEAILVPAQEVWFQTGLLPGESTFIRATTNGCALGGSLEEAALFGLLESVERDAFLTAWYARRPARRIDPDSITDPDFQDFRHRWQLAYRAYDFQLFDITTDLGLPTVMSVAVRRRGAGPGESGSSESGSSEEALGPRVFFANACRLTVEAACRTALEDLAGFDPEMTPERRREFRGLLEQPETVVGPASHFGLYALDETYDRLGFLDLEGRGETVDAREIQDGVLVEAAESYNLRQVLGRIDEHCRALGVGVYFKDITHRVAAERDLFCVKAVTPGLFPVWFGHGNRRFHSTHRLRRLAGTWHRHGHGHEVTDFNLEMHPFS